METNLWFKKKRWGWGWTPVTWQGWLTVVLHTGAILFYPMLARMGFVEPSTPITLFLVAIFSVILVGVCYQKGEKPSWSWGQRSKH